MATETLQVRLMMQANQYKREARDASTATGKIANSATTAGTATGKLDKRMSGLATTAKFAVAGVATAAVVGFAKDSIRAASDLQESLNAVNVVFGESADGIHAIGEESADSFGLAQSAFNEFAVRFSAFAKTIAQEEGRDVVDVVGEMTGRIADFASVHNLSLEEAAQVAQSTLAGETEVFRKFGGDVSAAAVQAEGLALGLSGVGDELTEGEKQLVRYRLFMKQTDDTSGDFKNTQDDLANATRTFNANLEDFKALLGSAATGEAAQFVEVGNDILTVLETLVNLSSKDIAGPFDEIFGFLQDVASFPRDTLFNVIEWVAELADGSTDAALTTKDFADNAAALEGELAALHGTTRDMADVTDDAAGSTDDYTTSVEALRFAEERQRTATGAARDAILAKRDALRGIHDPMFRVVSLSGDLVEAEDAVTEAAKKGIASPEYRDAVIDRAKVLADLETTMIELKEEGIDPTGAASRLMFEGLGVPDHVIDEIFAQFDEMQSDFESRTFRATLSFPTVDFGDNGVAVRGENRIYRQHGGPVRAGDPYIVGEAGPELFIPQRSGMVVSNNQLTSAGTAVGSGGTNNYNFYGDVYGDEGFMRKVREANVQNGRLGR